MFLQEHSFTQAGQRKGFVAPRRKRLVSTFAEMFLQEHLQKGNHFFVGYSYKLEKCSCRNTVENSWLDCCIIKQFNGSSH